MTFKKGQSGNPDRMFSKENQPANRGRKGKATTEYLKDIGNAQEIKYYVEIKRESGKVEVKQGEVKGQDDFNLLLAILLWVDALDGDYKARKEILDRVEGKPIQSYTMGGDFEKPIEQKISIEIIEHKKK